MSKQAQVMILVGQTAVHPQLHVQAICNYSEISILPQESLIPISWEVQE